MLVMHWHRDGQGRLVAGWNQEEMTRYRLPWEDTPAPQAPPRKDKPSEAARQRALASPALLAACGRMLLHQGR